MILTQAERLETMRAWLNDPAFGPGLHTLCDFSAATSTPGLPELREIMAIINRNATLIGQTRLAVVTARDVTLGVARQFQALAEASPLNVQIYFEVRNRRWNLQPTFPPLPS